VSAEESGSEATHVKTLAFLSLSAHFYYRTCPRCDSSTNVDYRQIGNPVFSEGEERKDLPLWRNAERAVAA